MAGKDSPIGQHCDPLLQRSDGGIARGEPRRRFGNASLVGLLGTSIHAALTHPLIRIRRLRGSRGMLKFYAKISIEISLLFFLGWVNFTCR